MANSFRSIFDIIGPVMVGPSSSHTAGAVRIGRMARAIYGAQPTHAKITFYGSFAHTYQGHGTDVAVISGLLGFETFDQRIRDAYDHAAAEGLNIEILVSEDPVDNPNTVKLELSGTQKPISITGVSVGGGAYLISNINGFPCNLDGELPALLVIHPDRAGAIAAVTSVLANFSINVAHMEVSRHEKGDMALMIIETDERLSDEILRELDKLSQVERVIPVRKIH